MSDPGRDLHSDGELRHLDIRGMSDPEGLLFIAKATRYVSRGTIVTVAVSGPDAAAELGAWAAWAGHRAVESPDGSAVQIVVRGNTVAPMGTAHA